MMTRDLRAEWESMKAARRTLILFQLGKALNVGWLEDYSSGVFLLAVGRHPELIGWLKKSVELSVGEIY